MSFSYLRRVSFNVLFSVSSLSTRLVVAFEAELCSSRLRISSASLEKSLVIEARRLDGVMREREGDGGASRVIRLGNELGGVAGPSSTSCSCFTGLRVYSLVDANLECEALANTSSCPRACTISSIRFFLLVGVDGNPAGD